MFSYSFFEKVACYEHLILELGEVNLRPQVGIYGDDKNTFCISHILQKKSFLVFSFWGFVSSPSPNVFHKHQCFYCTIKLKVYVLFL